MKSVDWLWPNNKRIAVVFNVCLEAWSDGKAPGFSHDDLGDGFAPLAAAVCRFDGLSDAIQEVFDVLLGGLNEQFPIGVSAHVLSEKVKALRHGRDDSS